MVVVWVECSGGPYSPPGKIVGARLQPVVCVLVCENVPGLVPFPLLLDIFENPCACKPLPPSPPLLTSLSFDLEATDPTGTGGQDDNGMAWPIWPRGTCLSAISSPSFLILGRPGLKQASGTGGGMGQAASNRLEGRKEGKEGTGGQGGGRDTKGGGWAGGRQEAISGTLSAPFCVASPCIYAFGEGQNRQLHAPSPTLTPTPCPCRHHAFLYRRRGMQHARDIFSLISISNIFCILATCLHFIFMPAMHLLPLLCHAHVYGGRQHLLWDRTETLSSLYISAILCMFILPKLPSVCAF